eukprot:SAG11_NODE_20216_length_450_cov_0.874644_1_plen_75_part_10
MQALTALYQGIRVQVAAARLLGAKSRCAPTEASKTAACRVGAEVVVAGNHVCAKHSTATVVHVLAHLKGGAHSVC